MALMMLMVVGSFAMTSSAKFEDVTDFQNEITILSNLGVIKGKADGTFGFDEAVTRRQEALFIARAATGKVNDTVWTSNVNNSQFKDLDATGDYYGAISYCANLGIIKGRTSTEFYPNDNIIFQEAVAMVVRALGYGSAEMDAGYPYTYYSKAVSLGLDKGIEDVALTDVVSRGVAAKLLYNAMFVTNSKGSTIAADAFGAVVKAATVVVVADSSKNLVGYNRPTAAGTVSFTEINADGTFNVSKVYNLNWNAFVDTAFAGDADKKSADYVGASFDVVTIDGFATLATASVNPFKSFDQSAASGNVIDGHTYTLVNKWSTVFNTGTTWNGGDELQMFNTSFVDSNVNGVNVIYYMGTWYLVDNSNNILEKNTHQVLLYYMGDDIEWVHAYNTMYAYKVSGTYYPAWVNNNNNMFDGAATVAELSNLTYSLAKNGSVHTTNVNSYSDTVAYDDDNDGLYERAYFTRYIFGRYLDTSRDNKSFRTFTLGAQSLVKLEVENAAINNISGKELKSGAYILWSRDALTGVFTVKKVYDDPVSAYVTAVNTSNKTITVSALGYNLTGMYAGTTLTYGVAKLPGATNTNADYTINDNGSGTHSTEALIGVKWDLQFQVIKYIVDADRGGNIVAIVSDEGASNPIVIDSYQGFTTLGYLREQVVLSNGMLQIINISKINDYPLFTSAGLGYYSSYTGLFGDLREYFYHGELLVGNRIDQLDGGENNGNWMVRDELYDGEYYNYYAPETGTITYWNGIAYEGINPTTATAEVPFLVKSSKGVASTTKDFSHTADGNFILITMAANGGFNIAKGVPANGASLTIPAGSKVYISGQYIYIYPEEPDTFVTFNTLFNSSINSGWNTSALGEDVIYFAGYKNAPPVEVINTGSLYNQYGTYYIFNNGYYSLLTGKHNGDVAGKLYSDNALLQPGFYTVKNMNYNGTTVKAFDKFIVTAADAMLEANIGNYEVGVTYLADWSGTWAAEVVDESVELTRANIFVRGSDATIIGNKEASTITAKPTAGTVYLALEYTLTEYDTGYIPSTKKFYFVIDTVALEDVIATDYQVYFKAAQETAAEAAGCTIDIDPVVVDGVLGYNTTVVLAGGYKFDETGTIFPTMFLNADGTTQTKFIPLSAFNVNNIYRVWLLDPVPAPAP